MPNYLLGRQAVAYYSSTALDGSNTTSVLSGATEIGNIMDLSLQLDSEFVDATTRSEAAAGFKSQIAVINNGQLTFEARWLPGDTVFDALIDAWTNGTEFTMIALDQSKATSGAQGLAANFSVSISKTEALQDVQKASITLSISSYPVWHTVS